MKKVAFLFGNDYFAKVEPDDSYMAEYEVLKGLDVSVLLFDLEDFLSSGQLAIERAKTETTIIYRGWMLKEEQYKSLETALLEKNYVLINTTEQYLNCHHLPKWYDLLKDVTPYSVWTSDFSDESFKELLGKFRRKSVMVKDYVKSRKHEWFQSCFILQADFFEQAIGIIRSFIKGQGEDLIGGVVLREYIDLMMAGTHEESDMPIAKEVRIFCLYHKPFAVIDYWSGDNVVLKEEEKALLEKCKQLDSNFYTVDLAQKADGKWIIIEVGDGQVSGLQDYPAEKFYKGLFG